ncbi:MAG: PIN domain-containing protein [Alphaproteobacteria bacterium]|nr:PIN domain-containing protein [Alphaproteobacteria bacterium]
MAFTVVYDANVLYPAPLRDLLVRVGMTGVVRVKWTDEILDEVFRNILANRPDLTMEQLARTRSLMNGAIRDVQVDGYQALVGALDLPDPGDRHVLAAAIQCGAQSIITHNLKDFPAERLAPHGVEAMSPDEFVLDLLDLAPGGVVRVLNEQQASLKRPPRTLEELMETLESNGLNRSMAEARGLLGL